MRQINLLYLLYQSSDTEEKPDISSQLMYEKRLSHNKNFGVMTSIV